MKLVRLTKASLATDESGNDGTFNIDFNDGIDLQSNSKIALQSVSADLARLGLTVNENNNGVSFSFKSSVTLETTLVPYKYNKANASFLLTNLAMSLNRCLIWVSTNYNKLLGMEFFADTGNRALVNLRYRIAGAGEYADPSQGLLYAWQLKQVDVGGDPEYGSGVYSKEAGKPASDDFSDSVALNKNYLCKGNGYIRVQPRLLTKTGDDNKNGFAFGLAKTSLNPVKFNFADKFIEYGLWMTIDETTSALELYSIKSGVVASSPYATVPSPVVLNSVDNDVLEVALNGLNIEFNIYQGAAATKTTLETILYPRSQEGDLFMQGGKKLFPFMSFLADSANCKVSDVRFTPSPFNPNYYNPQIPHPLLDKSQAHAGTSPPTNAFPISPTKNFIKFQNSDVALFLGFPHPRLPRVSSISATNICKFNVIDQIPFLEVVEVRGFVIQLLNIQLNSYDSYREQRENLVAVIPDLNVAGKLVYSPPTPYFIELNNKDPISLRNIKCRICNVDYTDVLIDGFAQINLLIE